jgi:hypothetical protein
MKMGKARESAFEGRDERPENKRVDHRRERGDQGCGYETGVKRRIRPVRQINRVPIERKLIVDSGQQVAYIDL